MEARIAIGHFKISGVPACGEDFSSTPSAALHARLRYLWHGNGAAKFQNRWHLRYQPIRGGMVTGETVEGP